MQNEPGDRFTALRFRASDLRQATSSSALAVMAGHGGQVAVFAPAAGAAEEEDVVEPLLSWKAHGGWVSSVRFIGAPRPRQSTVIGSIARRAKGWIALRSAPLWDSAFSGRVLWNQDYGNLCRGLYDIRAVTEGLESPRCGQDKALEPLRRARCCSPPRTTTCSRCGTWRRRAMVSTTTHARTDSLHGFHGARYGQAELRCPRA